MAIPNRILIDALRQTAERLRNGAIYAWGNHGACNCGNLLQVISPLSMQEILSYAKSGIGEWTAHYIALRALREPDAFPAADIGLLRALEGRDRVRPTPSALLARAERWRPWRAYAAQHLWSAAPIAAAAQAEQGAAA